MVGSRLDMSVRLRRLLPLVAALVSAGAAWDSVNSEDLNQALRDASTIGNLDKVQRLIARGADVNGKDEIGVTPLIMASMLGYSAVVKKTPGIRCGCERSNRPRRDCVDGSGAARPS